MMQVQTQTDDRNRTPAAADTSSVVAPTTAPTRGKPTMDEVMDELQSRFLMNLPPTELSSTERLFFQIEQCYWFYEDFYADHHNHLTHLKLNDFARKMFNHCVLLQPLKQKCESMFLDFKTYQSQIPVVGCILLNPAKTKLVLVCNWKGTCWSLPRGKVNQGEADLDCARREVLEECGYEPGRHEGDGLNAKDFIEFHVNQQRIRMYMVTNVPEDFNFAPQTRKEISLIQWFTFDDLPKKTWGVLPFMSRLRRWITNQGGKSSGKKKSRSNTPVKTRSVSAPRNRPPSSSSDVSLPLPLPPQPPLLDPHLAAVGAMASSRSLSTPHARPKARNTSRGHFGTEQQTSTASDDVNDQTFGTTGASFSFNVEEMFSINERLTGHKFSYDGNPHDFGKVAPKHTAVQTRLSSAAPVAPVAVAPPPRHPPQQPAHVLLSKPPLPDDRGPVSPTATTATSSASSSPQQLFANFTFDTVDIMACVK
ncbi:Aste57867_22166 [Aphanomyces stellatus]|uniref:Aste57867_22166 protein n=1 Tax=Aphanomyces stellatus TaxID=120398 RepID=A0A485LJR1_9STRA|nr:hypothetical protein As57867_022097 [Aphanomyces stellatus]VFT98833.1 Aste57867_22166 [Aphanomyces stellatus]